MRRVFLLSGVSQDEAAAEHKQENEMNWRLSMKGRPRKIRFGACPACAQEGLRANQRVVKASVM